LALLATFCIQREIEWIDRTHGSGSATRIVVELRHDNHLSRHSHPCCERRHYELLVRKSGTLDIIEVSRCGGDLSGMTPAISAQPHAPRAYDHRLREHVVRCGAKTVAKHVQIPRSTVSTWRRRGLRPVVSMEPIAQAVSLRSAQLDQRIRPRRDRGSRPDLDRRHPPPCSRALPDAHECQHDRCGDAWSESPGQQRRCATHQWSTHLNAKR
jgi:hypothetical protein